MVVTKLFHIAKTLKLLAIRKSFLNFVFRETLLAPILFSFSATKLRNGDAGTGRKAKVSNTILS